MWAPQDYPLPRASWNRFSLDRVLLDFDGPRLILRRSEAGQLYLAWWLETMDSIDRWIYLPLSPSRLHTILSGGIPTREALRQPEDGFLLVIEEDLETDLIINTFMTDFQSVPSELLPLPEARLNLDVPDEIMAVPMRDRAHVIDVTLEPRQGQAGRVGSRVVGQLIGNLQRLVDALGQAVTGHPTLRGSIPAEILEQTQLDVVSSYGGSFGIRLETHVQDDVLGESLGRLAIQALFDLMEAGSDLDKLTAQLQLLQGRVARSYEDLLGTIEESLPSATFRWAQGWQPKYRQFSLTSQLARDIRMRVQDVKTSMQEGFSMTGTLEMGDLLRWRFTIAEHLSDTVISGRISEQAAGQIQDFPLGSPCQAVLSTQIDVSTTTGEQQTQYTLVSIEASAAPSTTT